MKIRPVLIGPVLYAVLALLPIFGSGSALGQSRRTASLTKTAAVNLDLNLADFSREPFCDEASHGVLWRRKGLAAWRLASARAFGSLAAGPNGAKLLFDFWLSVQVEGEKNIRFLSVTPSVRAGPLWVAENATDAGLSADAVTQFVGTDAVLVALNLRNTGRKALRLCPRIGLERGGQGLKGTVELSGRYPALWLSLDRSQVVGRELVDDTGIWMGGEPCQVWLGPKRLPARIGQAIGAQGLDLTLTWTRFRLLRPGQILRVPVLLVWGGDMSEVQKTAEAQWKASALPKGAAFVRAKKRWTDLIARFPRLPVHERLLRRAVRALWVADYGRQAALGADQFSGQKGVRDAFFSVDTPLAALAWAELDFSKAEGAVLDLSSFSALKPAAVPPYTGDEKLAWDAAGLPLTALAAWELYQRDPQTQRADRFLKAYAPKLLHECAWWPPNRDGDGNGLYAFADADEIPTYMREDPNHYLSGRPVLQGWSVALTSLVAWQTQVAAALAEADGNGPESTRLLEFSRHSQQALHTQAWDLTQNAYVQGLDGIWPLYLGLETDSKRANQEIRGEILNKLEKNEVPWLQNGAWEPWRIYFAIRTLAEFGYFKESRRISENFLNNMENRASFPSSIAADGTCDTGDSAATAAVVLELLMEREQQNVYLTDSTGEFYTRFIQFSSLDGGFYMKIVKLPKNSSKYQKIKVETPQHSKIVSEGAMIFSCDDSTMVRFQSEKGLDISLVSSPKRLLFKDAHKIELLAPAHRRFLIRFVSESKEK